MGSPTKFRWKMEIWMDNVAHKPVWETGAFKPKYISNKRIYWKAYLYPGKNDPDLGGDRFFLSRFKNDGNGSYKEGLERISMRNSDVAWLQLKIMASSDGG